MRVQNSLLALIQSAVLLCIMCIASGEAGAQGCADYADYTHWKTIETAGESFGIALAGDYAYLADADIGLDIVDITNPEDPFEVGDLSGSTINGREVVLDGIHAYVADYDYGIRVVDVSDPANPRVRGNLEIPGNAWGLALAGDYLYVAARDSGLYVVDVERPTKLSLVGRLGMKGASRKVVAVDSVAYVANQNQGLCVVDIRDPTAPDSIGCADTGGLLCLLMGADYLYAVGPSDLFAIDVSVPTLPVVADQTPLDPDVTGVSAAIYGSVLYIADDDDEGKLLVFDISFPDAPEYLAKVGTGGASPRGLACANGWCFAATSHGLVSIQINNGSVLCPVAEYWPLYGAQVLTAVHPFGDGYAFGVSSPCKVRVFDISDPMVPAVVGSVDVYGGAISLAAAVTAVDIPAGGSLEMNLSRDIGLTAEWLGVRVVDLSVPADPDTLAFLDLVGPPQPYVDGYCWAIAVDSNLAYVSTERVDYRPHDPIYEYFFDVIDISDPGSPYLLSRNGWHVGGSMSLCGDYVYLVETWYGGIHIMDVSDPSSPRDAGSLTLTDKAHAVVVEGGFGYAGYSTASTGAPTVYLQVLDASNPESLYTRGSVRLPSKIADVEVVGSHAYVSTESGGLYMCDISDPDNPLIVGAVSTRDCVSQAAPAWGYIFIADESGGLQVAPVDCSAYAAVTSSKGRDRTGLGDAVMVEAHPNPFGQATTLVFDVPQRSHVKLSVYDVTGRRIATLVDRVLDAGRHAATLEGRNLAPGIYLAAFETGGRKDTEKVVFIK